MYRVHYKDHRGNLWQIIVQASSLEKAEELVKAEPDCRVIIFAELVN